MEIGTSAGWAAVGLALDDRRREVFTYDSHPHPLISEYLKLVGGQTRKRTTFVEKNGEAGGVRSVDFLFIDSSHERVETVNTFKVWRSLLAPNAVVAFHDYANPSYPGVSEAIEEMGLQGHSDGDIFVWHNADAR